ncbi:MAG TPA: Maf family nucleotide pyrophosphatase [Bdellovibrionota bacterium]|jgi:septum formation protein|nr:Maf family nucleotide pyrophosphatase [Bdellovibrionota bacterium]
MMVKLILASTSKYRAALLKRWGIDFKSIDPKVDEEPYKTRGLSPRELVQALSEAKARAVASEYPEAVVIGSDQVLTANGKIYGKSGDVEAALVQLMELKGGTQELLTGLCVIYGEHAFHHVDCTKITLRNFTSLEAREVIERDKSWDCAGSLKIEASGTWLIESLETSDPSAIEGLPLIALGKILRPIHSHDHIFTSP